MTSLKTLNPKAEVMGASGALFMNINAAKGLRDVMKTNLGPKGTIKMLVGGSGGAPPSPAALTLPAHLLLGHQVSLKSNVSMCIRSLEHQAHLSAGSHGLQLRNQMH